jgi:hypothetical protein
MRRLPWLFLLGLFVAGCVFRKEPERGDCRAELETLKNARALKSAQVVDVTNGPVTIPPGFTGDRVVNVSEPSTVYVLQDMHVVFAAHWRHRRAGSVTAPLDSVADNARPVTIGVWPGPLQDNVNLRWNPTPNCVDCVKAAMHKCCM